MILTRALRNDSLSFLGAYDAASFLPFVPGGLGGDTLPFPASHVLLRMCLGFLRYPVNIKYKTTVEKQRSLNRQKCECVTWGGALNSAGELQLEAHQGMAFLMITKTSQYRGPNKTLQIISIIELDWSSQHLTNLMHGFLHQHHLQTCYLDWAGKMVQSAAKLVYCESEETMQGSLMVSPLSAKCHWNAHVTIVSHI